MIDKIEIIVKGGKGGDGSVSFHREKFIPFGGPDGGDGGSGGGVMIVASSRVDDFSLLRGKRRFVASSGDSGGKWKKHGKKGEELAILAPLGTMVFIRDKSGEKGFIADLITVGQKVLVAKGGNGGLGNVHFATAVDQAPQIAGEGKPGEENNIILELKLITDMCIVGYPNSGKSTLLSTLSGARVEVADYPFTTRQTVLGVIQNSRREFIIAEIPALVEGAYSGRGLGNEFLRHTERTRLLIYLLDGSSPAIVEDFNKLNGELALYKTGLLQKPGIIAVNKIDLPQVQARLSDIKHSLNFSDVPVFFISAVSGQGVLELMSKAIEIVQRESQYNRDMALQPQIAVFHPKPKKGGGR